MEKRIVMECPFCDEEHELVEREEMSSANVKGKTIPYLKKSYYCEVEEEFCTSKMMDANLLSARDEYRKEEDLLTSAQIKQIREKYSLTQKEFSNLLGWGDITVQRYETKKIQDNTYDYIMRLCDENPSFCLEMLQKNEKNFPIAKYEHIRERLKDIVKSDGNKYLLMKEIRNDYLDYENKSEWNGFKVINIEKVNAVIGYFSNYIVPLYKVKLMKLLWYADVLYYKKHKESITGLVYQHLPLGAVPVAYNKLLELPSIKVVEELMNEHSVAYRIEPNREINLSSFTMDELEVLNQVASFFKEYNSRQIVDYMHKEKAYLETEPNQVISYDFAKYLSI